MCSDNVAIRVSNLSKRYEIYKEPRDRLKQFVLPKLQQASGLKQKEYFQEFWALQNVSFEIDKGETVGIIGRNGSGKSTLLQIICGTLTPTMGSVETNGRIAALLELGSGFNPEFTGRENVYMNAIVLGLSKEEVDIRFDEIAAFADIGQFIEQPVKTYSSGMVVRLAFAVQSKIDPDIFIVDEALAVGDMLFQAKCMIRLKQMVDNGVTVLFVSHDTGSVKGLCNRCGLFEDGRMVEFGKSSKVVDIYMGRANLEMNQILQTRIDSKNLANHNKELSLEKSSIKKNDTDGIIVSVEDEVEWPDSAHRYGEGDAKILDIKLLNSSRITVEQLEPEQEFIIQVSIRFDKPLSSFAVGYSIRDLKGQMLVGSVTTGEKVELPSVSPGDVYVIEISSKCKVRDGIYTISVGVELPIDINQRHVFIDIVENALVFEVKFHPDPNTWFPAMVKVPAEFQHFKIK